MKQKYTILGLIVEFRIKVFEIMTKYLFYGYKTALLRG
jgi:hypothetical protein